MFNNLKKWIQTTVDTTVDTVLTPQSPTGAPPSYYTQQQQQQQQSNYNNNNNARRVVATHHSSNASLSDRSDSNELLRLSNSHVHLKTPQMVGGTSFVQNRSPSPLILQQQQQGISRTQPPTPVSKSPTSKFPTSQSTQLPFNSMNDDDGGDVDLSHLSKEEQEHIAAVLQRAKIEEEQSSQVEMKSRKKSLNDDNFKGKPSKSMNSSITSLVNTDTEENGNRVIMTKKYVSLEQVDNNNDASLSSANNNKRMNNNNCKSALSNNQQKSTNNNNNNEKCELCNQQQQQMNNNNNDLLGNKMYTCEKCNKKCCINCRNINSKDTIKMKILCKNCSQYENNNNKKQQQQQQIVDDTQQQQQQQAALLATKQEIVNALINKVINNPVSTSPNSSSGTTPTTTTTTATTYNNKINKQIKVSNCDEYYPDNIPYIHHYHHHHHHHRRKSNDNTNIEDNNRVYTNNYYDEQRIDNSSIEPVPTTVVLKLSNNDFSHNSHNIDDETSFITYAEKEIANLERTIQLKSSEQQQISKMSNGTAAAASASVGNDNLIGGSVSSRIQIKELQDSHLVNSIENDSDVDDGNDLSDIIVYNPDLSGSSNSQIVPSSKFTDEFNKMSEQRTKSQEPNVETKSYTSSSDAESASVNKQQQLKSKRKLPVAPIETPDEEIKINTKSATTTTATNKNQHETTTMTTSLQNPKLENVTEWLNRSFDPATMEIALKQQQQQQQPAKTANKQIQQITLVDKQQQQQQKKLSDSKQRQSSEDSEKYLSTNDDIVEINLSSSAGSNSKKQNDLLTPKYEQQIIILSQPNKQTTTTAKDFNPTITIVDSRDRIINNSLYNSNNTAASPNPNRRTSPIQEQIHETKPPALPNDDSIHRIYLYKDPKDPSDSLGMKITARQKLFDLKSDLAALVTSIVPDGLVQRFDLPIKIGDEILEINGISLRNKTDEQIKQILNNSCEYNNGEIEIVIRKIETNKKNSIKKSSRHNHHPYADSFIDELQSVTSSIGTLDPNRSSPSARSSITSSPVSSDMTTNQAGYMRMNDRSTVAEIIRVPPQKRQNATNNPVNSLKEQQQQQSMYNKPLLKISAPPESDTPDFDENIFLSASNEANSSQNRAVQRKKYSRSQSPMRKNSDSNDNLTDASGTHQHQQSNKYLTLNTNKTPLVSSSQRSGSTKSARSRASNKELHRDSLSSNASMEDIRKLSPASSQRTAVNEDRQSHTSRTSVNTQATEIRLDLTSNATTKDKLNKQQQPAAATLLDITSATAGKNNMLTSASMSSIASARKYSNESCAADVESDNFSKYFPSSRENSRRNSREESAKNSLSNKGSIDATGATNTAAAATTAATTTTTNATISTSVNNDTVRKALNNNDNNRLLDVNKANSNSNTKTKPKLSFKFGKRSTSASDKAAAESLEARKNENHSLVNPTAPYGEIQLQIGHSEKDEQINVKIVRARNLLPKDANGFSDPFVKVYLLPGRDQDNKRRTKPITKNLNPEWNYTVVYPNVHKEELKYKTLEFTVWDWDRFKSNDFLGKVKIDLSDPKYLDDKPRWYPLKGINDNENDANTRPLTANENSNVNKSNRKAGQVK